MKDIQLLTPKEIRALIRNGKWDRPTAGLAMGYAQAKMYITNIPCKPAGIFHGPLVVTMRPLPLDKVTRAVQITSRYALVHGAPIHIGDPSKIGIKDLKKPEFGDPVTIKNEEVPVFWACGVTPQAIVMKAKPDLCITHTPGHMFISDLLNEELAIL